MQENVQLDTRTSIFISYSRRNSAFVDRLEADLKSRDFYTWVDRRKIEGGQRWKDELKDAIDRCEVLLVVLSPEAVASHYVNIEYSYALQQNKLVIPVLYQPCPEVPIDLNGIQWVDFEKEYQQGLDDLLIALNHSKFDISQKPTPVRRRLNLQKRPATLATPRPKQLTERTLDEIYREGVEALSQNNLELTAALWQQVLERAPNFRDGTLTPQLDDVLRTLQPIRIARLHEEARQAEANEDWRKASGAWQALLKMQPNFNAQISLQRCLQLQGEDASKAGDWDLAISAWEALLKLRMNDSQATRQRELALHNQKYLQYYMDAQQFIKSGKSQAAAEQLKRLWKEAPYYGDPLGLATKARITRQLRNPVVFEEDEKQRIEREAEDRRVKFLRDQQVREKQERERRELQQRDEEIRQREREEWLANEQVRKNQLLEQRAATEAARKEEQRRRRKALEKERNSPIRFIIDELETTPLTIWCSFFCLLSGTGFIVDTLFIHPSHIWPLAVMGIGTTVVLAALLLYLAGYYKAIGPISMVILTLLSGAASFGLVNSFLPFLVNYDQEQKSHLLFNLVLRSFWLGRQLSAGLIIGIISGVFLFFLGYGLSERDDRLAKGLLSGVLGGAALGVLCWTLLAIFAWLFNWGWGFGSGSNLGLLLLAIGAAVGSGCGTWLVILFQPRN